MTDAKRVADVSAAVLAGGASRRMGRDKALLPYRGEPLILRVFRRVESVFIDPFVVSNDPARFPFLRCPIVPDRLPGFGPLSGIDAALRHASHPFVFVCGCDMPFLSARLMRMLAGMARPGIDLVLPAGPGGPEPLCAVWGKTALPAVGRALAEGALSPVDLSNTLSVHHVAAEEVEAADPGSRSFRNLNTPADWESLPP